MLTLFALAALVPQIDALGEETALDLFEQRIMPIFRSPQPSSCVQCHLASVELKNYILPSHEDTFVSLRDQGLINVAQPDQSKILTLIRMGEDDQDERAKRIHEKTRRAELSAFAAWIRACCNDPTLVQRPRLSPQALAKPAQSLAVIRHARKDRVLDSFIRNVWSQRMRCFPCHTPHEIDPTNPQHLKAKQRHRDFVRQYGARMNLFKQTPEETMRSLLASGSKKTSTALPMINLKEPRESLFVLKPTSKVPPNDEAGTPGKPSSVRPVSHVGGLKMHVEDISYMAIVAWISDVANVKHGQYDSASDLPPDNWYPTRHVIRMKEAPDTWQVGQRVQLQVHARSDQSDGWEQTPVAFTQGTVTPRRFVGGTLMLLRLPESEQDIDWNPSGVTLPPGEYLVKVYLDSTSRIVADPSTLLGAEDFQGQLALTAEWNEGFQQAQVLSAKQLSR